MTNQATIDKLIEMRLTTMADTYRTQCADPKMKEIPFEDRFGLLVDVEYSSRKNNRLKRLIRNAEFDQPEANIADHRNVFIIGATGSGKSYMACALGMEACKRYYNTKYIRLPDLLLDLENARQTGTYKKAMAKYANPILLILDEWLLMKPSESEQKDIFELLHRRRKKSSTVFCSQYHQDGWYEQLGGDASPLADAILDRIVHDGYSISIEPIDPSKDISMREVYGLDPAEKQ